MKKYIVLLAVALIGYGCASVYSPAGNWDYIVEGTPEGNVTGTMVLTETEGVYTGKFVSNLGDLQLENVKYTEEEGLSATFYYQGIEFLINGTFEEEKFSGMVDGGPQVGAWPMTANRVEEK